MKVILEAPLLKKEILTKLELLLKLPLAKISVIIISESENVVSRTGNKRKLKNNITKSSFSKEIEYVGTLQEIAANYVIVCQKRLTFTY